MAKSKRLAITISGAISLGAYEAGVLYEVIKAIGQHNQNPATPPEERIEIDVLTGASAGGMTAAIAAQKLLLDGSSMKSADNNPFYLPWVKEVDLTKLLDLEKGEDPAKSIFSSDLIEDISRSFLTAPYKKGFPGDRHPAAAETIQLGLAMSHLNGIDYSAPVKDAEFRYTRFQDEYRVQVDPSEADCRKFEFWESVRNAAVACGAFPFAFRVKNIQRNRTDYDESVCEFPNDPLNLACLDGGIFQNEPLGIAKAFVNRIDKHRNTSSRFYLYVAPGMKSSAMNGSFSAEDANMWETAKRLLTAIFQQARFQDWVMAHKVNEKIQQFDKRALELKANLENGAVEADQLAAGNDVFLAVLFSSEKAKTSARNRLKNDAFKEEYDELSKAFPGSAVADAWIDAVLVLEAAANLQGKEEMKMYTITATDEELAGDWLGSFGGFFDERFRQHDYDMGRIRAREFLAQHQHTSGPDGIGPIRFSFDEPAPVLVPGRQNPDMKGIPKELRHKLKNQLLDRLTRLLKQMGLPGAAVLTAKQAFLLPKLNAFFHDWPAPPSGRGGHR